MGSIYETGEYLQRNPDWHAGESPWKTAQLLRMIELHYFSRDTALRTLEDTGYRVIDWFYTRRAIEEPATELRRRLARGPRRLAYSIHRDLAVRALGGFSLLV